MLEKALAFNPAYLEFIFIPNHPAMIDMQQAADLIKKIPPAIKTVGIVHDADDDWYDHLLSTVPLDIVHLIGDETASHLSRIKDRHHVMVMKSFFYKGGETLKQIENYLPVLDYAQLSGAAPPNVISVFGYNVDSYALPEESLPRLKLPVPWFVAGNIQEVDISQYEKYKEIKRLSLAIQ
jgi:phosphoribosylanthranilate isomerase